MSWISRFVLVVLLALPVSGEEPKHIITCATVAPKGSPWMKILDEMDKELRQRTDGQVGFRFYAGGIQGEEKAVVEKIRGGQLNAAGLTGIGLGALYPDLRVLELPMLFRNYREYDHVRDALWKKVLKDLYKRGYLLLGLSEAGFAYMYSTKKINSLGELRSSKIWLREGDPLVEQSFKHLKMNSVPQSLANVLTSLSTGNLETVYVSPAALRALQWSGKVKYQLKLPIFNILAGLVYQRDAFKKLPKPYQKVVRLVCFKHNKRVIEQTRKDNLSSMAALAAKGIESLDPTSDDLASFRKECEGLGRALAGKVYSEEIYQEVLVLLSKFRAGEGK